MRGILFGLLITLPAEDKSSRVYEEGVLYLSEPHNTDSENVLLQLDVEVPAQAEGVGALTEHPVTN